jgi:hypothetical protein
MSVLKENTINMSRFTFETHVKLLILYVLYNIVACTPLSGTNKPLTTDEYMRQLRTNGSVIIDTAVSPNFKTLLEAILKTKHPAVAVISDRYNDIIADRFTTVLIGAGWSVIERSQLEYVLSEQKLSMSGLLDPRTRLTVGRILGINFILICKEQKIFEPQMMYGHIDKIIPYIQGNLKIIDIETGAVMASSSFKWIESEAQNGPQWVYYDLFNKLQAN